jgi:branched-chain amino acid aminotransferase
MMMNCRHLTTTTSTSTTTAVMMFAFAVAFASVTDAFQQSSAMFRTTTSSLSSYTMIPTSSSTRLHMSATAKKMPGSAQLDTKWEDLGFEFRPTNSHVRMTYRDGEGWSDPELVTVRLDV